MKRWLILLSVGCLAFATGASASVQKGDTELEASFAWMSQSGVGSNPDFDAWFLSGALGYFVTDNIQVAVAGFWSSFDWSSNLDLDVYGIGAKGKYHFMPTNQWVPYVGGQIYWANADVGASSPGLTANTDTDAVLWGPVVGARYELNANNDFFIEYQYHIWDGDIDMLLDDGHALFGGIVHQFK